MLDDEVRDADELDAALPGQCLPGGKVSKKKTTVGAYPNPASPFSNLMVSWIALPSTPAASASYDGYVTLIGPPTARLARNSDKEIPKKSKERPLKMCLAVATQFFF